MDGKQERLPVQRIKPLTTEAPDLSLKSAYESLLTLTSEQVFKTGELELFECGRVSGQLVGARGARVIAEALGRRERDRLRPLCASAYRVRL